MDHEVKSAAKFWALISAALILLGCVNVNVPKRTRVDIGRGRYEADTTGKSYDKPGKSAAYDPNEGKKISKKQAYRLARAVAQEHKVFLPDYKIKHKEIDDNYWILFECKYPNSKNTWQNHFAIRVSKFGVVKFYKRPLPERKTRKK